MNRSTIIILCIVYAICRDNSTCCPVDNKHIHEPEPSQQTDIEKRSIQSSNINNDSRPEDMLLVAPSQNERNESFSPPLDTDASQRKRRQAFPRPDDVPRLGGWESSEESAENPHESPVLADVPELPTAQPLYGKPLYMSGRGWPHIYRTEEPERRSRREAELSTTEGSRVIPENNVDLSDLDISQGFDRKKRQLIIEESTLLPIETFSSSVATETRKLHRRRQADDETVPREERVLPEDNVDLQDLDINQGFDRKKRQVPISFPPEPHHEDIHIMHQANTQVEAQSTTSNDDIVLQYTNAPNLQATD